MRDFSVFLPIGKVDAAQRLVYGTLTAEVADKSGEIFDYASGKPAVQAWSDEIKVASGGKSLGNVRAMHGKTAAGKFTDIVFDDANKRIEGAAKIVDDDEWQKVVEGVYTGFSIGGSYTKRWQDPENPTLWRFTPELSEISLVDNPCVPTATFEYIKADGTREMRKFTPSHNEDSMTADTGGAAAADNTQPAADAVVLAKADVVKDGKPVKPKNAPVQKWLADDGEAFSSKREAELHNLGLEKKAELAPGLDAMEAVLKGAKKPEADDEDEDAEGDDEDTKKAKKARRDEKAAKAKEKAEGDDAEIAAKAKKDKEDEEAAEKAAAAAKDKAADTKDGKTAQTKKGKSEKSAAKDGLSKGLHQVGWLAHMLDELTRFQDSVEIEQYFEDDKDSELPAKLKSIVSEFCELLVTLVEEETSELSEGDDTDVEVLEMAAGLPAGHADAIAKAARAKAEPLAKSDSKAQSEAGAKLVTFAELMEKAGARHSKADGDRVQKLHDNAAEMHKCMGAMVEKCAGMLKAAGESKNTAIDLGAKGDRVDDEDDMEPASKAAVKMSKALDELNAKNDELLVVSKLAASQNETLLKAVPVIEELKKQNAELTSRMEHLEGQPLPAKGHVRVISKTQDGGGAGNGNAAAEFEAALAKMTPEQKAMAMMKASLSNPLSKI